MFAQINFFDENRHKIAYTMYLKLFDLHKLKMVPPMRAAAINYNKRPNFFIFFREFIFRIMKCFSTYSSASFQIVNTIHQKIAVLSN